MLVVGAGLTAAAPARAKEGARAQLTAPSRLAAKPGTMIRVQWSVDTQDDQGGRHPSGASGMFVRLLSRTDGPATVGFARGSFHADGRYEASVRVPETRIGGIRFGLRGWNDRGPGDLIFPLANDPFTSPGGVRCDVAVARTALAAFVRAYNRGDLHRLDRLFSREPRFLWYSWGGTARSDRPALIPNFHGTSGGIACVPSPSASTAMNGSETWATSSCTRSVEPTTSSK